MTLARPARRRNRQKGFECRDDGLGAVGAADETKAAQLIFVKKSDESFVVCHLNITEACSQGSNLDDQLTSGCWIGIAGIDETFEFTFHSGIRPFDNAQIIVTAGDVEELQARDNVTVTLSNAGTYPVYSSGSFEA